MPYNPRTDEIRLNVATVGDQIDPAVTRLANGNLVAVWSTPTTAEENQFGIAAQFFDSEGNRIGSPFFISQLNFRLQYQIDATPLSNGGLALSWTGFGLGASIIKTQFFDASGAPVFTERDLAFGNMFDVGNSEIAGLASGSAVLVWDDFSGAEMYGAIVAPNGNVQNFTINTTTAGTGIDVLDGGAGNDIYFVGNGGDIVVESLGGGFDAVYASTSFQLGGGAEVELLATTGLTPGQGVALSGNSFTQSVIGGSGNDNLAGGGGNDQLTGNDGNDIIDGGAGVDGLRGGGGADTFPFIAASETTGDSIYDFVLGTDKIDVSQIDANSNLAGDQAFTFIGSNAFSGAAGELRVESSGGLVHVLADLNGDGAADMVIHLYNILAPPPASDFVL